MTLLGAIQKRSHEPTYKKDTKKETKRLRATTFYYNATPILKKKYKLIHAFEAPIIFSSTVLKASVILTNRAFCYHILFVNILLPFM